MSDCKLHAELRLTLVDNYQSWRPSVCPWCKIARLSALLTSAADFIEREARIVEQCHTINGVWDGEEPDAQAEVQEARQWLESARSELK